MVLDTRCKRNTAIRVYDEYDDRPLRSSWTLSISLILK